MRKEITFLFLFFWLSCCFIVSLTVYCWYRLMYGAWLVLTTYELDQRLWLENTVSLQSVCTTETVLTSVSWTSVHSFDSLVAISSKPVLRWAMHILYTYTNAGIHWHTCAASDTPLPRPPPPHIYIRMHIDYFFHIFFNIYGTCTVDKTGHYSSSKSQKDDNNAKATNIKRLVK